MPNPNIAEAGKNTQFKPGESGNPAGKPKGTKHLSTWIQELLNDEKFEATILQGYKVVDFKGAPIKAIVQAQMIKALNGDEKAFKALAKYGYGEKLDITSAGERLEMTPLIVSQIAARGTDADAQSETEASS